MTADLASIHRAELRCFMELKSAAKNRTPFGLSECRRRLEDECCELDHEVSEIYFTQFQERLRQANAALDKR